MEQIKVFLDTNIVLDYYSGRMNDGLAERILQVGDTAQYGLCISVLTGINVLYIARKMGVRLSMDSITELFAVLPVTEVQWNTAAKMHFDDPEDALQLACAEENGCRVLITRDSHLLECELHGPQIMSPEEFLSAVQ